MIGLGSSIAKPGKIGKRIVRDGLVLKHDYNAGAVEPVSTGAANINADGDSNEYIDVGPIAIGTGDVSLSAWVNVSTFVNLAGIISNRQTASTYPGLEIRTRDSSIIEIAIDDGGSNTESISGTLNTNQWYHVCAVFDRSDKQFLYIDGVLVDSADITSENLTLNHSDSVFIGRRDTTGYDFQGYICNVGYWNAALTQPQVKSIMHKDYAALSASEKTNLVSWWNLDETLTDTTVLDNHYGGGSYLGSELVTDGPFNNGTLSWSSNNNWTYSDGTAVSDGTNPGDTSINQSSVMEVGKTYVVSYEIISFTSGSGCRIRAGSGTAYSAAGTTLGVHSFTQVCTGNTSIYVKTDNSVCSIDNVSVKLVNGNTGTLS